jgi:hypothetical protein
LSEQHGIDRQVSDFLAAHIDSVLELELLLLLRARRERAWTAAELASELKIDPTWAAGQLEKLAGRGILGRAEPAGCCRYEPKTPEVEAAVAAVADAYATHRVSVIGLIFSKPTSNLKSFADAFRIRTRENPDG